jgi:hypothetical protein
MLPSHQPHEFGRGITNSLCSGMSPGSAKIKQCQYPALTGSLCTQTPHLSMQGIIVHVISEAVVRKRLPHFDSNKPPLK